MTLRATKLSLVFAVAVLYTFVVLNNVTDHNSSRVGGGALTR